MKRFMVIELSEELYNRLQSDHRRIPGSIGLLPDGETLDFNPYFRSHAPRPRRRRLDTLFAQKNLRFRTVTDMQGQVTGVLIELADPSNLSVSAEVPAMFSLLFNHSNKGGAHANN